LFEIIVAFQDMMWVSYYFKILILIFLFIA
jgi:hypothetical protein